VEDKAKGMESYTERDQKAKTKLKRLPPGVKNKKELEKKLDECYKEWLDLPLTALDGLTPKEAARTAEGKKKLNIVLRELENIYKLAREHGEPYYDIKKVRLELKLK
jgi:hypothetical protein